MKQAVFRLVAWIARLACIAALPSEGVVLLVRAGGRECLPGRLLARLLALAGYLKGRERPILPSGAGASLRLRLATQGHLRAEFAPLAWARFRCAALREAADFATLGGRLSRSGRPA